MDLILAAHGTRKPGGVAMIGDLAAQVSALLDRRVQVAFVDVLGPTPSEVLSRAAACGRPAVVVPAFLSRGYHVRKVLPGNRGALPPEINMHSVKNRFLMRIKNISPDLYRRNIFSITLRDVTVVMCCLVWEHTSLRAFWYLARNWRRVMAKRAEIQRRRRVDHAYIASWFKYAPVSVKAPKKAAALVSKS